MERVEIERVTIERVTIDSRAVQVGDLFVAVVAERDGHDFAAEAIRRGARAVLASRPLEIEVPVIVVDDTVEALTALGRSARNRLSGPVVGVTGSVGKTSTKDLLASICAVAGPVTASEKSLNNELGVPLTLVNAAPDTQRTIVEMGARGVGHIAHLRDIARPSIGLVTAVAMAHTELFGSIDGVATAKAELVEALPVDGFAILNANDPRVAAMAKRTDAVVITYGSAAHVRAEHVTVDDALRPRFTLVSDWGTVSVRLAVAGPHNVSNALGAAAAALQMDIGLEQIAEGLEAASLSPSRMAVRTLPGGGVVIDDAYNANPTSMRAALDSLAALRVDRRVAVLGHMAELGVDAPAEHRAIAAHAASLGIELVAVGTDLYGVEPLDGVDAAITDVPAPRRGEAVLLKASRVAGLERIAAAWSS
ncbi:MAG: UDP-N-acetylmuramoyl-tripeptide--D-alanyl-D-alanine ligase [Actinobacteria bacterium]|nr:UDP-N-acetylmuramoyl-tripeptide--D-alanyl-D-alanine ligase [Actinomycetota bacterium]